MRMVRNFNVHLHNSTLTPWRVAARSWRCLFSAALLAASADITHIAVAPEAGAQIQMLVCIASLRFRMQDNIQIPHVLKYGVWNARYQVHHQEQGTGGSKGYREDAQSGDEHRGVRNFVRAYASLHQIAVYDGKTCY
jgi:hypothetical protein